MQLSKNRNQITELKGVAADEKGELKASYDEKIAEMDRQNLALESRLKSFESEEKEDWQNFKQEFDRDMDALALALKDLTKDNVN